MHRNNTEKSHANMRYAKSLTPSPTVATNIANHITASSGARYVNQHQHITLEDIPLN